MDLLRFEQGPQAGDAVGRGAPGSGRGPAELGGDVGVGHPREVVQHDGRALLVGQRGDRRPQVARRPGSGSVVPASGTSAAGTARRERARSPSSALRWAIVTSQPRSLLSGRSRGYARSAARNVSDQASSASAGGRRARHTRITTVPCSRTSSSNGRTGT